MRYLDLLSRFFFFYRMDEMCMFSHQWVQQVLFLLKFWFLTCSICENNYSLCKLEAIPCCSPTLCTEKMVVFLFCFFAYINSCSVHIVCHSSHMLVLICKILWWSNQFMTTEGGEHLGASMLNVYNTSLIYRTHCPQYTLSFDSICLRLFPAKT